MIGDLFLKLYKVFKQNFCIHHYKRHIICSGDYVWWKCEKCGRVRSEPI